MISGLVFVGVFWYMGSFVFLFTTCKVQESLLEYIKRLTTPGKVLCTPALLIVSILHVVVVPIRFTITYLGKLAKKIKWVKE